MTMATDPEDLEGRMVLVAGGTTALGESIVRELILAKATVVVPVALKADADRLERIIGRPELLVVEFDVDSFDDVNVMRTVMDDIGNLFAVVDATGGWHSLANGDLDSEAEGLVPDSAHFHLAAEFFPLLSFNGGVFIQILGTDTPVPLDASHLVRAADAVVEHGRDLCERPWRLDTHRIRLHAPLAGPGLRRDEHDDVRVEEVAGLVLTILLDPDMVADRHLAGVEAGLVHAGVDDGV